MDAKDFLEKMGKLCESHIECDGCPLRKMCSDHSLMAQKSAEVVNIVDQATKEVTFFVSPKLFVGLQVIVREYEKSGVLKNMPYFNPIDCGGFSYSKDDFRFIPFKINREVLKDLLAMINSTPQTGLLTVFPNNPLVNPKTYVLVEFHKAVAKTIDVMAQN